MQPLGYRMEEMIFTLADQNFFFNEIEVYHKYYQSVFFFVCKYIFKLSKSMCRNVEVVIRLSTLMMLHLTIMGKISQAMTSVLTDFPHPRLQRNTISTILSTNTILTVPITTIITVINSNSTSINSITNTSSHSHTSTISNSLTTI